MRKLLNVLYVTSPEAYLGKEGETVLILLNDEVKLRIPIHNLEGIVCFGYTGASPALMHLCAERGVALSFLAESGKFLARVSGRVNGNVLLRRRQYRQADSPEEALQLAKGFILGKIFNCRCVLQRFLRDHEQRGDPPMVQEGVKALTIQLQKTANSRHLDMLRGVEGEGARVYYGVFDHLILEVKDIFTFTGRSRRPPLDAVNALLSFLYTLLAHDCTAALETVGLDPQVGFLHRERPGRPSLALDLMEELRPYLVDRFVVSLINTRQIGATGFVTKESGGVLMTDEVRKNVITAWQKRKQEEVMHPFLGEKIPVGLIPYAQALLLARHLRGDLEAYPPFLMK
ncbi:type I-C CRISPR-associated endonuclease Cas1c [Hydrogenispora ethanolica]|uniref:type I-C CRISPR-associated endonuclease Cas1c n=1 Tax=Hydrogenispora ethanolica TaxID=1082276 RepID=UPI001047E1F0|nr:type I-C CRISPR-associated endonuclease Cas1c [Hydrogenispora ethanolica]